MSYCRFSCLDYQSDVYVYQGPDGYHIHCAANAIDWGPNGPPPNPLAHLDSVSDDEFTAMQTEYQSALGAAQWLPHDMLEKSWAGTHTIHPDAGTCADKLVALQQQGANVPAYAIETLRQEAAEDATTR